MEYYKLAKAYQQLEQTTKRLEKAFILAKILKECSKEDLQDIIYLLQGKVFPPWDERKIGISDKIIIKVIANSTGNSANRVEELLKKEGDLGIVAEILSTNTKQKTLFSQSLTTRKVAENIRKAAEITGEGTVEKKIGLISELLTSAKPLEARFIARTVLEQLRAGVAEGTLRDAIVWAFLPKVLGIFFQCNKCKEFMAKTEKCLNCRNPISCKFKDEISKKFKLKILHVSKKEDLKQIAKYDLILCKDEKKAREVYNYIVDKIQHGYDLTADFAVVASAIKEEGLEGLENIGLVPGSPLKVMLYPKAENIKSGFEEVGRPAGLEFKYDGFRLLLQRKGEKVWLFTRRLEDVTKQFPDVVEYVKEGVDSANFILDCETIGIDPKTKQWLPFQNISQRIKRKYDIEETVKEIPVMVKVFDVLSLDGKNLLNLPFRERRRIIEKIVKPIPNKIGTAEQLITDDEKKAEEFYKKSLAMGNEGIMMKSLDAEYKPGRKVGYGVKIKPVMESLDLVIVKAEWGQGKRATWLSSFTLACRDLKGDLFEIGKVGTGIKEKSEKGISFKELTKLLKPLIIKKQGTEVEVKPDMVVEVEYEEIQSSPSYSSGYALRFPRVIRIRPDRGVRDIATIEEVKKFFKGQYYSAK